MKLKKFLSIVSLISIVSMTSASLYAQKAAAQLRTMATAWMDALNRHDTDAIAKMYSEDAHLESPNWQGPTSLQQIAIL
jgi:ketosteroid isomerase-like protein